MNKKNKYPRKKILFPFTKINYYKFFYIYCNNSNLRDNFQNVVKETYGKWIHIYIISPFKYYSLESEYFNRIFHIKLEYEWI